MKSEEGERRKKPTRKRKRKRKRKREKTIEKRDQALTIAFGEGDNNEKGGFEANSKQPVLSPTQY